MLSTAVSRPRETGAHAAGDEWSPAPQAPGQRGRRRGPAAAGRVLLALVVAVLVTAGGFVAGLFAAPFDERAVPPPPRSGLLLASDGSQVTQARPPQRREVVPAGEIPEVLRSAVISAEDGRFLQHHGVDPLATLRAAYRDVTGARGLGGSTLTQQYVRDVYVGDDRSLVGKVREAVLAVRLERRRTKEEILTDYLNVRRLGDDVLGVQAASASYFGVDVKDLDLDEATGRRDPVLALARASMLAGIAPAPSVWDPVRDPATALSRQRHTLNQMVVNGYITPEQASDASTRRVLAAVTHSRAVGRPGRPVTGGAGP